MTRDEHIRMPPCAIEAECAVLGGLMISPASLVKISDWLTEDDFYQRNHRAIFRAVTHLADKGRPCDSVTLSDWLRDNGLAEVMGGVSYVIQLESTTPSAANIVAYAEIVKQKADLRRSIDAATEAIKAAYEGRTPAADIAGKLFHRLGDVGQGAHQRGGLMPVKAMLGDWYQDLAQKAETGAKVTGLPTPWHDLNELTHGLQDGEVTYIAARPSMGKSILGNNLAAFTALRGHRTAVFSLEMTARQIITRSIAQTGSIPHRWLHAPENDLASEGYWSQITKAMNTLASAPLLIDETPGLNIQAVRARALRAHAQAPLRLLVVDHLHIMGREGKNEASELGQISRGLKGLAKELNCPVVALAQLNRSLEQRTDKRPVMADLRSSGDLEQDADQIWFIYRDEYYNPSTHLRGVVEVAIGKGRDIETGGVVNLRNRYDEMRAEDWIGPLPEKGDAKAEKAKATGFQPRDIPVADYREVDR